MKFFDKIKDKIGDLFIEEDSYGLALVAFFIFCLVGSGILAATEPDKYTSIFSWICLAIGIFQLMFVELMFWFSTPEGYLRGEYSNKWEYAFLAKAGYFFMGLFLLANLWLVLAISAIVGWLIYSLFISREVLITVGFFVMIGVFIWLNTLRLNGLKVKKNTRKSRRK